MWIIWLPFLLPGVIQLLRGPATTISITGFAAVVVFVAVYAFFAFRMALALSRRTAEGADGDRSLILGRSGIVLFLLALSVVIALLGKPKRTWITAPLFIFTAAYAGTAFRIP